MEMFGLTHPLTIALIHDGPTRDRLIPMPAGSEVQGSLLFSPYESNSNRKRSASWDLSQRKNAKLEHCQSDADQMTGSVKLSTSKHLGTEQSFPSIVTPSAASAPISQYQGASTMSPGHFLGGHEIGISAQHKYLPYQSQQAVQQAPSHAFASNIHAFLQQQTVSNPSSFSPGGTPYNTVWFLRLHTSCIMIPSYVFVAEL